MQRRKRRLRRILLWDSLLFLFLLPVCLTFSQTYHFRNPDLALDVRLDDLLAKLTTAEKISLLHQWQPAIPRLGIESFRTGTESLHGIAWLGTATVFPQAIALGTTWDRDLIRRIGSAIADEARGFHARDPYNVGLSLWAPVADLLRDPRAG